MTAHLAGIGPEVYVHVARRCPQHPVARLDDPQHVARVLERTDGVLDGRGRDHDDVDDRLRGETGHARRADVLDTSVGQRGRDAGPLDLEPLGPRRVVVDDDDRARFAAADEPLGIELARHDVTVPVRPRSS